jgi:hypothetical protein
VAKRASELQALKFACDCFLNCLLPTEAAGAFGFCIDQIETEILHASWASEFSHGLEARFHTAWVESRCGAVALGRTYLFPPLSSGGALVVPPWLRFHIPLIGRVEGCGAPVWPGGPDPHHVSSPLHVARNVRISRIARPHLLHAKAYGTYPAGATFGPSRRTR